MRTLGSVLSWLMHNGAPIPTAKHLTVTYPGGSYPQDWLTFTKPGYVPDPDAPEWKGDEGAGQLTVNTDLLMLSPKSALVDLVERGIVDNAVWKGNTHLIPEYPN